MTSSLGLDHALVAVRDIKATRDLYMGLGFLSRGFGQHPWGTSTTLLIFVDQLFEIVSIGDPALLDGYETGGFRFGRHVEHYLEDREGVALTALNSRDAEADAAALAARGIAVTGSIDFGRDVTRADGTADRTRTTLKVIRNGVHPRLSLFACQQFRRDLIEYPEWMDHPNGVTAIAGLTVLAGPDEIGEVAGWLARVHGSTLRHDGDSVICPTAKGAWSIMDAAGFLRRHGVLPPAMRAWTTPSVAAVDLVTLHPQEVETRAKSLGLKTLWQDGALVLPEADRLGGVCLRFGAFGV